MAFHRHLIDILWDVAPADIAPATPAEVRLALEWYPGEGVSLCSRWTHARD